MLLSETRTLTHHHTPDHHTPDIGDSDPGAKATAACGTATPMTPRPPGAAGALPPCAGPARAPAGGEANAGGAMAELTRKSTWRGVWVGGRRWQLGGKKDAKWEEEESDGRMFV